MRLTLCAKSPDGRPILVERAFSAARDHGRAEAVGADLHVPLEGGALLRVKPSFARLDSGGVDRSSAGRLDLDLVGTSPAHADALVSAAFAVAAGAGVTLHATERDPPLARDTLGAVVLGEIDRERSERTVRRVYGAGALVLMAV